METSPNNEVQFDPRLQGPFTMLIAGPTSCGKSHLVFNIIENAETLITPSTASITYCYSQWQPGFEKIKNKVTFHEGLMSREELFDTKKDTTQHRLLIIDDLMDPEYAPLVRDLFIRGSHHLNISVVFITQNLFMPNKDYRTLSLNAHYLIVFKNPRDMSQIRHLGQQAFPAHRGFLTMVYNNETQVKHSYIVLDCKQGTPNDLRVRGSVTTPGNTLVFIPNNNKKHRK